MCRIWQEGARSSGGGRAGEAAKEGPQAGSPSKDFAWLQAEWFCTYSPVRAWEPWEPSQGLRTTQLCCLHSVHQVHLPRVFNSFCLVVMGITVVITCVPLFPQPDTLLACISQLYISGVQIVTWCHPCVEISKHYYVFFQKSCLTCAARWGGRVWGRWRYGFGTWLWRLWQLKAITCNIPLFAAAMS